MGIDIGTTAVKALLVDADGNVVARSRVPHRVMTPSPDFLEHDADQAWRRGPRKAFSAVTGTRSGIAAAGITAMVPSMTAVDRRGIPRSAGLLYGDRRGMSQTGGAGVQAGMPDAEGQLRWAASTEPGAHGYWPAQAVASQSLCGVAAIDTVTAVSFGRLHTWQGWDEEVLSGLGVEASQMPSVLGLGAPAGRMEGSGILVAAGTVDALGDQIVSGAEHVGDVLVVFGATLVMWVVTDEWIEVPGYWTVPHTVPGRVLVGGPSNAGALFHDWASSLLQRSRRQAGPAARLAASRAPARPGPRPGPRPGQRNGPPGDASQGGVRRSPSSPAGALHPGRVPVWLPWVRGERVPFHDPGLSASLHGLDISQGPEAIQRAADEAAGFVIRRLVERSGVSARRIVASGGGTRDIAWMKAVADASGLPVDLVAVPEGAALGAAFVARIAAGLEEGIEGAGRWARVSSRVEPDPAYLEGVSDRYRVFRSHEPDE